MGVSDADIEAGSDPIGDVGSFHRNLFEKSPLTRASSIAICARSFDRPSRPADGGAPIRRLGEDRLRREGFNERHIQG